ERLVKQQLPRSIRDVILPAHDVCDLHERIVDHHGEIVGWCSIGPEDDRISNNVGVEPDVTSNDIVKRHLSILRHSEANRRTLAIRNPTGCFVFRYPPAITGRAVFRLCACLTLVLWVWRRGKTIGSASR